MTGLLAVSLACQGVTPVIFGDVPVAEAATQYTISDRTLDLNTGAWYQLTFTPNSYYRVEWTTDNPSVASVTSSSTPGTLGGLVTALGAGSAVITGTVWETATSTPDTIQCTVRVTSPSGNVRDMRFGRITDTTAEFYWEGTSGDVFVEVKTAGGTRVHSTLTNSRRVYVSGLSPETEYKIYLNNSNREVVTFYTRSRYDYYDDRYYYDGSWYYYDDYYYDSERYVRDFTVDGKSDTHVDISWRGTSSNVYVELRKRSSNSNVSSKWANRSTSFTGLSPDTEYSIYIDGRYMTSFTTDKYGKARDISIQKNTANRSVDISWSGTSGTVEVALKKNGVQVDSKRTSDRKVTFYNLEQNKEYYVYIDDKYVDSFTLPSYTEWTPPTTTNSQPNPSPVPSPVTVTFTDISGHWAKDAVERLASYGVVKGFKGGLFKPDKMMTREEFIVMLVAAQKYLLEGSQTGFQDVNTNRWSAPYIAAAIKNGIIIPGEYSDNRFVPQKFISREEAAVMISRALKLTPDESSVSFTDSPLIKDKGMVGAAIKAGIIKGLPDNRFNPRGILNRGSAAVMINEFYKTY
jgi:hypothetical protein